MQSGKSVLKLWAARYWLEQGAELLPVQPHSKYLVQGYGLNLDRVRDGASALHWWQPGSSYNLAIITPPGLLALDFDDLNLFTTWQASIPSVLAVTYQETSPRGFHVFFWCTVSDVRLVKGVEIKRVILVAPSQVFSNNYLFTYRAISAAAGIVKVDDYKSVISSLLLSDCDASSRPETSSKGAVSLSREIRQGDLVVRIKNRYRLYDLMSSITKLRSSDRGAGRWYMGLCPFHEEDNPSLWLDNLRGVFGCHACGARGDVINLYAWLYCHESVTEAIEQMAEGLDRD